ncbi:MAG TPA: radical SAM protein, partial [Candidatus Margulisiibacteriota bacterium]|nr:radical SAM protein [Candidatus Margulisiibacteriota bacterium]
MRLLGAFKTVFNLYLSRAGLRRAPYSIFWLISWECNSRCLHCEWGKSSAELALLSAGSQELPLGRVKEILTEASSSGAKHIAFAGGEPFLRKDFLEILAHCKKEGYAVTVSTNAYLLSNFEFARQVILTGIDRLDISLDAADKLHDKLRGVDGAFKMVDAAIDNLKKLKGGRKFYLG